MADGINILIPIIAVVIALVIAVPVACKLAVAKKVKQDAEKIGTAEEKARNIIDEALKTAETKKREALLEAKEESLKTKNELEKETREFPLSPQYPKRSVPLKDCHVWSVSPARLFHTVPVSGKSYGARLYPLFYPADNILPFAV